MPLPLEHLRVVDLTRVRAGPTAVRQFADWGAEVIMVDPIEPGGVGMPRHGSDFQNLNRNKRSLRLDLKSDRGREVFARLVAWADVLFENYRPDVKHRLKIDYETVRKVNPRLVYVSISGFGQDGPYVGRPGLDQIAQGIGGLMSVTGLPGQGPVRAGIAVADTTAGLYAAIGAMTALLERQRTGEGRWVQTSLLQAQIAVMDFQAARWLIDGVVPGQVGNEHPTSVPSGIFPTQDGVINIATAGDAMPALMFKILVAAELADDPRFRTRGSRNANRAALADAISALTRERATAELVETLNAAGVPCGPVNAIDATFADPQVEHLGMAKPVSHPKLGELRLVAQPIVIDDLDPALTRPAPDAGEHSSEILLELGFTADEVARLEADGVC